MLGWIAFSTCLAVPVLGGVTLLAFAYVGVPLGGDVDPLALLDAGMLAGLTALQFLVMLVPAVALALVLPPPAARPPGARSLGRRLADAFPFRSSRAGYWVAAALLGATAGALPSWITDQVAERTGWEMGIVQILASLEEAALPARLAMYAVIAVGAPVVEELIFRGFLWAAIERSAPTWVAWVATSLVFGAYHLDPLHVLAVLPLGIVLGWLRWRTGGLWAPMLFHLVNNGLALLLTLWAPEWVTGLAVALASAAVSAVVLGIAWTLERRPVTAG